MYPTTTCVGLSLLFLLFPGKSQSQSDGMLSDAKDLIKSREYDQAFTRLWVGVSDSTQVTGKARELVRREAGFRNAIKSQLEEGGVSIKSRDEALLRNTAISRARWYGIIDDSVGHRLQARHDTLVYRLAKDRAVPFLLSDTAAFPSLRAVSIKDEMFMGALKALEDPRYVGHKMFVKDVFNHVRESGSSSTVWKALEVALPNIHLTGTEIREYAAPLFPDFARQALVDQNLTVALLIEPADRLLEIDLGAVLKSRASGIHLVKAATGADSTVRVILSRLRYEERVQPEQRNTISISQTEIGVVRAALLMPRNATYMYDAVTKSVEIDYAFELKASQKGVDLPSVLLRDRAMQQTHLCSNFRVQNVFGGSEPVTWYANDRMQADCGGSAGSAAASIDVVRQQVLAALAQAILTLPPIAKTVQLWR